jgi:hypothetical protein
MRYILILLLLTSCSLSEVLETPMPRTKTDTTYIPRQLDTNETSDIPIGFEVTIEDWGDTEIDINL